MSTQIQSFDAAFSVRNQDMSSRTSAAGTSDPIWLNGMGAQFAAHSSGLSGEQRRKVMERYASMLRLLRVVMRRLLLIVNRSD